MTFLVALLLICFHSGCHLEGKPPITSPKTRSVGESQHIDAGWAEFNKISTRNYRRKQQTQNIFRSNEFSTSLCGVEAVLFSNKKRLKIFILRCLEGLTPGFSEFSTNCTLQSMAYCPKNQQEKFASKNAPFRSKVFTHREIIFSQNYRIETEVCFSQNKFRFFEQVSDLKSQTGW